MLNINLQIRALAERSNRILLRCCKVVLLLTGLTACIEPPYSNVHNARSQTMLEQHIPIFDIRRPEEWRQTGVIEGSEQLTIVDGDGRVMPDILDRFTLLQDSMVR